VTSRTNTSTTVLAAALCAYTVMADGIAVAQTKQGGRVSQQQATQLAFAGLKASGQNTANFRVDSVRYQPDKHRWLVTFLEFGPMVSFDSDMLACVDDRSGKVHVQQAMAIGPCT
jgi:hypothetical protein